MTTLNAIGFTTAGSSAVALGAFAFFSVAVRTANPKIAPRCSARSPETVFNPKAKRKIKLGSSILNFLCCRKNNNMNGKKGDEKHKKKHDSDDGVHDSEQEDMLGINGTYDNDKEEKEEDDDNNPIYVQYRGGPMFGWIPWTMSLSYEQMLKGIPGTGTRKNGMEGSMLKVNLDGIVLLRFHAICLRMAFVGTILAIAVVLPINLTANCFTNDDGTLECYSSPYDKNLTNYEMTTIENIPVLEITDDLENQFSWYNAIFGASFKIFGSNYGSFLGRLYAIVAVSWIMIFYCLHLLKREWIDALALRRVFYLEGSHWENRIDELNDTVLKDESDDDDSDDDRKPGALRYRRLINKRRKKRKKKKKKKDLVNDRPPWIPHPEQRDTVPNIELYSVLVGQIPSAPSEIAQEKNDGGHEAAAQDLKAAIDWQLRVTTTFFDQCVPNQPGFSSSVAAVTMLPDAPKLATAWKAWYRHCSALRRLRFIRELIKEKRHYDIDLDVENEQNDHDGEEKKNDQIFNHQHGASKENNEFKFTALQQVGSKDYLDDDYDSSEENGIDDFAAIQKRIRYYSNVFGVDFNDLYDNNDLGANPNQTESAEQTLMTQLLSFGPEQTAVYSKEFARGAAACCPNGCREEKKREQLNLRALEELEAELVIKVKQSYYLLVQVQQDNVIKEIEETNSPIAKEKDNTEDVEMQLFSRTPTKFSAMNGNNTTYDTSILTKNNERQQNFFDEGIVSQDMPRHLGNQHSSYHHNISPNDTLINLPPLPPRQQSPSLSSHVVPSSSFQSDQNQSYRLTLSNQGKAYYKEIAAIDSNLGGSEDASYMTSSVQTPRIQISHDGDLLSDPLSTRNRLDTGLFSVRSIPIADERKISDWQKVQQAVQDNVVASGNRDARIASGSWKMPSCGAALYRIWHKMRFPFKRTIDAVDEIKSTTTFAVVTFTSRQAAVAARHCLADGRGVGRWIPVEDIPVPPLADAAVCDFCDCRGCCRPVTLTIHPKQQLIRRYTTILMLSCIFIFYTLPLTFASAFVAPSKLKNIIPGIEEAAKNSIILSNVLSGILPAFFWSIFFALCPIMFKTLSNFGSNAVSLNQAEFNALRYYWWFMLFTAFSGTSLTTMALNLINERGDTNASIQSVLLSIASTLPTQVSATWLNWIIFRTFCTLPLMYMLNIHTFIFQCLGWKCCIRCVMGGGPGGPVPYRIYIDSGVVFMCMICLAPVSPFIAPAALLYFLFCAPLWRRNCIYMYRPNFDTGGIRWPFLSDMMLSAICAGQVLLTTTMALKKALGPAILSGFILIPVYLHRRSTRKRYLRSYLDAALLQTSQLDGWDNTLPTSLEMREEYRKFLVDAHRAAYVPICLAGEEARSLTNEPAVVVPHPNDCLEPTPLENPLGDSSSFDQPINDSQQKFSTPDSGFHSINRNKVLQPGASFRRVRMMTSFQEEEYDKNFTRNHSIPEL